MSERLGAGYGEVYVAGADPSFAWAHVDRLDAPAEPKWPSMDDLQAKHPEIQDQLRNKIKKCKNCGKPCAFTLTDCNSCGSSIKEVEISYSPNVFMGFVYGVGKAGFPLKISLRLQQPDVMVFDDLLSLSTCHLNAIPTDEYIPDWRYLLQNPERGLAVMKKLDDAAWKVTTEQFLGNPAWKQQMLNCENPEETLRPHIMTGMNYPPSQYQLHLQYIVPPHMPFHYYMIRKRNHYTFGRFFPAEYVVACLSKERESPHPTHWRDIADTSIEDVIAYYDGKGIKYADLHQDLIARYERSDQGLAKWPGSAFSNVILDGSIVLRRRDSQIEGEQETAPKIQAADKEVLQNYGRPYDSNGKPTGTYYSLAKAPGTVQVWTDVEGKK